MILNGVSTMTNEKRFIIDVEEEYCIFGEGYCKWCRACPIKYEGNEQA